MNRSRLVRLARLALLGLLVLPACGKDQKKASPNAGGHHVHKAPNGGTMIPIGNHEADLEILVDFKEGKITAWLHGDHAKKPLVTEQKSIVLEHFDMMSGETIEFELFKSMKEKHRYELTDQRLERMEYMEGVITELDIGTRVIKRPPHSVK